MITYVYYVFCILTYVNYICCLNMFIISSHYFVEPGSDKSGFWMVLLHGSVCYCVDELVALSQEVILLAMIVFMLMLWMIPVLRLVDRWWISWFADDDVDDVDDGVKGEISNLDFTDYTDSDAHGRPFRYCCETRLHKAGLDSEHGMPATYRTLALNSTSNHNAMYVYVFFVHLRSFELLDEVARKRP